MPTTWPVVVPRLSLRTALNKEVIMSEGNITIHVKDNETIDRALKRFKKKFEQIGVLKKLRARMYYKKPSVQRRDQRLKAIHRQKMQA